MTTRNKLLDNNCPLNAAVLSDVKRLSCVVHMKAACQTHVAVLSPQRGLEACVDDKLHHLRSTVSISSEFLLNVSFFQSAAAMLWLKVM